MPKITVCYSKAHIGGRINGYGKQIREAYRVQFDADTKVITVSDMLDEGGWFAPTVEKVKVTGNDFRKPFERMVRKYTKKLEKELGL